MITLQPLLDLRLPDIERVTSPYTCNTFYQVTYFDTDTRTGFELHLMPLDQVTTRRYDHFDQETIEHYLQVIKDGYSVGAYADSNLVGFLISEVRTWNSSLWVWEFHVAGAYRGQGIGRQLMDWAAEKSRAAGLRTIICETQNRNPSAIQAYRKLGFQLEGIDISYYTNEDYPDRDVAVFMKRRL